jgi:hypothetical protein
MSDEDRLLSEHIADPRSVRALAHPARYAIHGRPDRTRKRLAWACG